MADPVPLNAICYLHLVSEFRYRFNQNWIRKPYVLCTERIFDSRLFMYIQQNIFGKTPIGICSPHFYASFGTFCVQIGQLFAAQGVFKHSEEFRNRQHFPSKTAICRFSNIFQRLPVPRIIDQFGSKRCEKKRKDVDYKLL